LVLYVVDLPRLRCCYTTLLFVVVYVTVVVPVIYLRGPRFGYVVYPLRLRWYPFTFTHGCGLRVYVTVGLLRTFGCYAFIWLFVVRLRLRCHLLFGCGYVGRLRLFYVTFPFTHTVGWLRLRLLHPGRCHVGTRLHAVDGFCWLRLDVTTVTFALHVTGRTLPLYTCGCVPTRLHHHGYVWPRITTVVVRLRWLLVTVGCGLPGYRLFGLRVDTLRCRVHVYGCYGRPRLRLYPLILPLTCYTFGYVTFGRFARGWTLVTLRCCCWIAIRCRLHVVYGYVGLPVYALVGYADVTTLPRVTFVVTLPLLPLVDLLFWVYVYGCCCCFVALVLPYVDGRYVDLRGYVTRCGYVVALQLHLRCYVDLHFVVVVVGC